MSQQDTSIDDRDRTILSAPCGLLACVADGTIEGTLRAVGRTGDAVHAALNAIASLQPNWFWRPAEVRRESTSLLVRWTSPGGNPVPLAQVIAAWRRDPVVGLPAALRLVRQVLAGSSTLDHLPAVRLQLSPAQVFQFREECGRTRWLLLPLPFEGVGFLDLVGADDRFRAWLSAETLLEGTPADRAYMIGAALYDCIVDDLFPADLPKGEQLRRLLIHYCGNATLAHTVLTRAMPPQLAATAHRLAEFVMKLLVPRRGRSITVAQAVQELSGFEGELSAPRLADAWETAKDITQARAVMEEFAAAAPQTEVPWDQLNRLRRRVHPTPTPQREKTIQIAEEPAPTPLIGAVRRLARGTSAEDRRQLEELIGRSLTAAGSADANLPQDRLREATDASPITDEECLYLVYAAGRWLGQIAEDDGRLARRFPVSWHNVIGRIIGARLAIEGSRWAAVSRLCRDGLIQIKNLPAGGETKGRYAESYLDLIDGIAHIGAVTQAGHSAAYLQDAFTKLANAWDNHISGHGDDLDAPIRDHLRWLAEAARRKPGAGMLQLGVEAYCNSLGFSPDPPDVGVRPTIPWFDEARLFLG